MNKTEKISTNCTIAIDILGNATLISYEDLPVESQPLLEMIGYGEIEPILMDNFPERKPGLYKADITVNFSQSREGDWDMDYEIQNLNYVTNGSDYQLFSDPAK